MGMGMGIWKPKKSGVGGAGDNLKQQNLSKVQECLRCTAAGNTSIPTASTILSATATATATANAIVAAYSSSIYCNECSSIRRI
ncbi:hypothetical protein M0802_009877 [Mischocyttarus mexicanus]|nr:hypothetical protein M0802_009877 [Mischocyttarus mexicanus]